MPRIRRWFHVSHDINSDPEVWELTEKFGDRGLRAWLEILSIADRNEGLIPSQDGLLVKAFSIKLNTVQTKTKNILRWFEDRTWLVRDPVLRVRNYAVFNPSRDAKGKQLASPPILSEPNHPNHSDPIPPKPPKKDEYSFHFGRAWKVYGYGSKAKAWEAWKKLKADSLIDVQEKIFDGLAAELEWRTRADNYQRTTDARFFIPEACHLSTWLNQRRWDQVLKPIPEGKESQQSEQIRRILAKGL